jgi:hypothetical protein
VGGFGAAGYRTIARARAAHGKSSWLRAAELQGRRGLREAHRQALAPTAAGRRAGRTGQSAPVVPSGGGGLGGRCALAQTLPGSR